MTHEEPWLPKDFLANGWCQRPQFFPNVLPPALIQRDWVERFWDWCCRPAILRVFVRTESKHLGGSVAFEPHDFSAVRGLFEQVTQEGESLTVLLNALESVSPEALSIRDRLGVGYAWRHDDVVGTLSSPSSGIGYHAGHEDGFIVQLAGSRVWRLWHPNSLPEAYRLSLLGHPAAEPNIEPERPTAAPLAEYYLNPGDVLHIPALYGHEGITTRQSVSLSIAWMSLTPFKLLRICGLVTPEVTQACSTHAALLFDLLRDPERGNSSPATFLFHETIQRLSAAELRIDERMFLKRLNSSLR